MDWKRPLWEFVGSLSLDSIIDSSGQCLLERFSWWLVIPMRDQRKVWSNTTYRESSWFWMILLINISSWGYSGEKEIFKDMLTAFLSHKDRWTEQEKVLAGEDRCTMSHGTCCLERLAAQRHQCALFLSVPLKTGATSEKREIALSL